MYGRRYFGTALKLFDLHPARSLPTWTLNEVVLGVSVRWLSYEQILSILILHKPYDRFQRLQIADNHHCRSIYKPNDRHITVNNIPTLAFV
jgi:hypothetical protein